MNGSDFDWRRYPAPVFSVTQALHENKHLTEDHLCQQPPRLPHRQCAQAFWFV